jgi:hypothetical protein
MPEESYIWEMRPNDNFFCVRENKCIDKYVAKYGGGPFTLVRPKKK